ncbi:MAG TPA: amino acid adenylation domain-containing protein [Thermoanaerobaculia bacterium]|nr:amino acid adenylation domain-containing protein [Thermoanaerobaculia bacterium]
MPIQYPDYAAWQRRWLSGAVLEEQVAHWRERLAGAPAALELPTDRPRPAVQGYRGVHVAAQLPAELREALAARAGAEGVTLFMVLLAGFDVLLYRHSGQADLLVGSPIANRTRLATEGLIGFFVNTLVFRADLTGDPPARELLGRVRDGALAAYAHQELPFEKLVEALQPVRDLSRSPLFQVMFQFQNLSRELPRVGELRLASLAAHSGTAKFDLTLTAAETVAGLRLFLEYDRDLFDSTTAERLLRHYRTVLAALAADAGRPLSELLWLDAAERHQLVAEWNGTPRGEGAAVPVPDLIAAQARRVPQAVAVACGDERLSHAELERRAALLAARLRRLGAGPEALVGIALERTPEMVAAVLGVLRSGAAYVPLDPAHPRERLALILEAARPLALVTQQSLLGALPAHAAAVVLVDGEEGVFAGELEPVGGAGDAVLPEQTAYVLFTSGSTGRPKGVQVPHGALSNFLLSMQRQPGFAAGEALLAVTTLSFDIAGLELLLPLIAGGRVELATREEAAEGELLQRRLAASGATVLQATPATWRLLLEAGWPGDRRLTAFCGGEALPGALAGQLLGRVGALWNMYGPTETTIWSATRRVRAEESDEATVPVGGAIAATRLYVLDERLEPVALGVAGELAIGGAGLARGYLGAPELTAERFVPDPHAGEPGARMYRTGDLVRWRADGRIDFLGRMDFQVKVRGFRIELGEIEAALARHPAVAQAVVMAREVGPAAAPEPVEAGKRLVAYVVPRRQPAAEGLAEDLPKWLAGKLPEYMVPSAFVVLEALPLNPSGKVDRRALPEPARAEAAAVYVAPRGLIEERLAGIWCELLRLDRVGAHDSFFALGGHSLLAARLVSRLRGEFAVEVPLRRIFEVPTLAALAAEIAALKTRGARAEAAIERVTRDRPLLASFGQDRLWFLDRLDPGSTAYTMAAAWSLSGPLVVPALRAALAEVVRRHEALRTVFAAAGDAGAVQRVSPFAPPPVPLVDLAAVPPTARAAAARALAAAHARRPFDLAHGPLFRAALLRLGAEEHLLLFAVHHTVSDAWSQGVLVAELSELYAAAIAGRPSPLPPLPIQYADYAAWQRRRLQGRALAAQVAFWREALAGAPALLELPTDRPRPAVQTFAGARRLAVLPPPLLARLRDLSRRQGATLFMTLLAAFQALLARWSGAEDLTVGTPIAGRTRRETEGLIGLFVNTLVLRAGLAGDPAFADFLAQVRERALAAFAHQDLPFEKLVEALNPERALSHTPLFQVLFVLQNAPRQAAPLPGLRFGRMEVEEGVAKFDLTLAASETAAGLALSLEFNRDLFDAETAERLLGHLRTLLAAVVEDPGRRLSELPWLTAEERRQLAAWNDTARDYGPAVSLHALIAEQVERTPEAVAVVFEREGITYRELDGRAGALARRLRRLGVGPESLVAVAAERSLELVVALLGVLKAGAAYVPIDPSYPAERLAYMLDDSQAGAPRPVVLTQERLLEPLPLGPLRARGGEVVLLDGDWQDEGEGDLPAAVDPDHPAYMIYTSGSTGRPKGAVNSHRAIVNRLVWMQEAFGLGPEDRVLQKTPFSFDVSVWEFFWPLLVGARLVVARPGGHQDARYLARLIQEEGITTLHFVPSMLQVFLEEPQAVGCRGLKRVVCSGEALAPELVRRFFERLPGGSELHNLYGPTEAAVDVSWWACSPEDAGRGVPIGRPIANLTLTVVDRDLRPVAVGVPGELLIGGVGLARGYHNRPDLTAEKFVPDPSGQPGARLYRTGDLTRLRPDGAIEYLGRLDHQIKLRGFRIELGEIEAALRAHPAVREVVVVARGAGEAMRLVAYLVGAGGEPPADALREHLRSRLPEHMVPSAFVPLPALPLSPNGKVDRKALPDPAAALPAAARVAPRTLAEELVAEIWREVLERESVGVQDNFFDLGGHSLKLVQVQRRLEERTGRELSIVDLFRHPTIAALAEHLAGADQAPAVAARVAPSRAPAESAAIAIVGMAGRFPGAASVGELWRKLCAGEELIRAFGDDELRAAGVDPALLDDPHYVRARGVLDGTDLFDAGFFDYAPREAQLIDPQQRVFLECACEALEDAGHGAPPEGRRVGVFAGTGESGYAWDVYSHPELVRAVGAYQVSLGTKNDYLPTRVSYKLDLKGPSVNVQTACSTSLVAVHLACRALLAGECDLALAGGAAIAARQQRGYLWEEGHIFSPDGHCRAFDAKAAGTVTGSGAGVVVLRRLADALADGDRIDAVILGSAINNDGAGKVGFTAPSVDGQAAVIAAAQRQAGVDPATIGYVEAHGTGTPLGDPIEVRALTQVFRAATAGRGFCALGSVKTNVGHLDAAAGVTGLIKAALAVKHGRVPPSLHFETPNPELRLAEGPFYVASRLQEWPRDGGPRRAGVSSFGIGGTNAHVVLEEAPVWEEAAERGAAAAGRAAQLLLLSAKSAAALEAATDRLADHLETHLDLDLADVAHTLRVGRRAFAHRRAVVCASRREAAAALRACDAERVSTHALPAASRGAGRPVAFLFPGQGAQHAGMGAALYAEEPVYREALDRCCALFVPELGRDLRELLHATGDAAPAADAALLATDLAQPALFAVEWALAALWGSWGVRPEAMLGHSLGEYVAACLAGVFTLEDAVRLVAARGRLMGALPRGAMLSAPLAEAELRDLLAGRRELALAAVNGPASCVVSGPEEAIGACESDLRARGVEARRLHTSHAFHSAMMDPALPAFHAVVETVRLRPPALPYLSNLTGAWITAAEATDPAYWVRHLRGTVRFADGLAALLAGGERLLLEVGPGRTLTTLATQHPARGRSTAIASLRRPRDPWPERAALLAAAGRLWLLGATLDWRGFQGDEKRRRVPLPTYPFERRRYWVERAPARRSGEALGPLAPVATAAAGDSPAPGASTPAADRPDRLSPYVAPRDAAEQRIAALFGEVLGVAEVGAHDDFFDLGGSSLLAVRLAARLRDALGIALSPHALLQAPTVAALAREIAPAAAAVPRHPLLVPLAEGGPGVPLFLVHPAGGHVFMLHELAAELEGERPVWGLRARGLEEGEEPLASVEEMAALYLEAVAEVRPQGPWLLGGSSMGGMVAFEMAQRLRAAGDEVALALFDTYGPGQMPPAATARVPAADRLAAVLRAGTDAMFAYRPRPYPGRLAHFRAAERRPGEPLRPEQPWIDLALEGAEVHVVPGDHLTMHQRPHVAVLARRLRRALGAA